MNQTGKLSPSKAKELYLSGLSLNQIAKQYNISSTAVNAKLTKLGVKKRNVKDYIHPKKCNRIREEIHLIKHLYCNEGKSLNVIGSKYEVSGTCIGRILREHNIDTRKGGSTTLANYNDYDIEGICLDYQNEELTSYICQKYNITKPKLYSILRKSGITLRNKQQRTIK